MVLRALRPFALRRDVRQIALVVPGALVSAPPDWLRQATGERVVLVPGGQERMDSVESGLRVLPPECGVVLVHDAARPFVSGETIEAVVSRVDQDRGAIAAVRITDTLKESGSDSSLIHRTIPRDRVWRATTPQGFPRAVLVEAFARARADGVVGTDEASLVERLGCPVALVEDSPWNIKITTAEDLRLAELIAEALE